MTARMLVVIGSRIVISGLAFAMWCRVARAVFAQTADPERPEAPGQAEPPATAPEPPATAPEPPATAPEPPATAPEPPATAPEPPSRDTAAPEAAEPAEPRQPRWRFVRACLGACGTVEK